MNGTLEANRGENPFNDWSILHMPYVTGDFHVGDNMVDFVLEDGTRLSMAYNGYNNVSAALEWLAATGISPDKLLVAGQSAGGFAAEANVMRGALRHILGKYGDRVTVLHSETISDNVLAWFEARLNGEEPGPEHRAGWTQRMLATYGSLNRDYPNFYLYLTDYGRTEDGKTTHTLSLADSYYDTNEDGVSLATWLADAVIRGAPYDVGLGWLD